QAAVCSPTGETRAPEWSLEPDIWAATMTARLHENAFTNFKGPNGCWNRTDRPRSQPFHAFKRETIRHGVVLGEQEGRCSGSAAHRWPPVRARQQLERGTAKRRRRERLPGVTLVGGVRRVAPRPDGRCDRRDQGQVRVRLRRPP